MLTNRTLARINNRPREVARVPLLAAGGGTVVLAALLYLLDVLPPLTVLAVLGGGMLLVLLLYATQKSKMTIKLSYKGKLDDEAASRFSDVQEALEGLSSSEGIWRLPVSSKPPKAGEVAPVPERDAARVEPLPTPGIKADVPIWGIEAADGTLFFFPEGALYYTNDRYNPVPYESLKMTLSSGRFFEEIDLPSDATVVDHSWRYSRPDGSPDSRYKAENVQIPIVLYNMLDLSGSYGLGIRLLVSNRKAAINFARVFGAEDLREKKRKDAGRDASENTKDKLPSAEELEREARLARARKVLGVAKGASAKEIAAAYRKLALAHHPDRVAGLNSEVREYSEQRMKEINAAYAELRGQGGSVVQGARTV